MWPIPISSFQYDAISRLDSLTQDLSGTSDDQTLSFSHNPTGQVASRTVTNAGYAWAGHVNVNEVTTINGLNQIATEAGVSFGYDARGNLTSDGETSYWYDADNRLTGATGGVSFAYDALGRLYEASGNGMAATRFLYDGADLLAEYDTSGSLQRRFVHGPRADEPLVWYEGAGTTDRRWLVTDERGSVVAVTDDGGDAIAINRYDEYGQPGSGNLGRFQFTGQAWIEAVGLYYYKARFYAPAQGRFMQTDPIGYGDGLNLYGYAGGDPVNRVDPSGTDDTDVEEEIAEEPIDNVTVTAAAYGPMQSMDGSMIMGHFNSSSHIVRLMNFWADQAAAAGSGNDGGDGTGGNSSRGGLQYDEIVVTAKASRDGEWRYYIPGSTAGMNAAAFWADVHQNSNHPLASFALIPGLAASLWTPDTAVGTFTTLSGAYAIRIIGPFTTRDVPRRIQRVRQYVRFDRPHHGKGWQFDGIIPNWIRDLWKQI